MAIRVIFLWKLFTCRLLSLILKLKVTNQLKEGVHCLKYCFIFVSVFVFPRVYQKFVFYPCRNGARCIQRIYRSCVFVFITSNKYQRWTKLKTRDICLSKKKERQNLFKLTNTSAAKYANAISICLFYCTNWALSALHCGQC